MDRNNDINNRQITFSKLALALANDYQSIYVVDSVDDSYVEYSAAHETKELKVISSGDDFYSDLKKNCELLVYPEDREHFLAAFRKENYISKLGEDRSFTLDYRLMIDGKPVHYFLKTIRTEGGSIIIGVQNVDAQRRHELEAQKESLLYSEIAQSLASLFEVIYYVDIATGNYTEYSSSESFAKLGLRQGGEDFFTRVVTDIKTVVHPDDCEKLIRFIDKSALLERLSDDRSVTMTYRQLLDGKTQYLNLIAFHMRNNEERIVIGVRNVDAQKRLESEYETYGQIAGALASRYEAIYYINTDTNEYKMYSSSDIYEQLGLTKQGEDFFADAESDIRQFIHRDDIPRVLEEMKKEHLLANLEQSGIISLNYRQQLGGNTLYVNNLIVRPKNDSNHIVMGVSNIDAQVRRESAGESYGQIASALAGSYEVIYYIDAETNEYSQYSSSEQYAKLGLTKQGDDFFADTVRDVKKYIHQEDQERLLKELTKECLLASLEESSSLTFTYRQMLSGRPQYVTMLVVRPKKDKRHIVMGVTNIDNQIRREQSLAEENRAFSEIALALAQRYEVIYHVDLTTNEYIEYSVSEQYSRLNIGPKGKEFFAESRENLKRMVYKDDQAMVAMALQRENMIENMRDTGKYSLNYRLVLDGRPQYMLLYAVRPKEDSKHIIVAVANIDAAKRRELDYENAIGSAMDMANRDPLTGVRNKRGYIQTETEVDKLIGEHSAPDFAIVVCDINGLKQVNDTQGHNAGDSLIKSACDMLRGVFPDSCLFRIGGDEFAVLLRGSEYYHRAELMTKLRKRQEEHREKGLVTVAYGISDFDPVKDMHLQDVFERADDAMYDNKHDFKSGRETEKNEILAAADKDRGARFDELFQKLVKTMTDSPRPNVPLIEELLIQISLLLRLCKGITRIYKNSLEEREDRGETLNCFDLGGECVQVRSIRLVTSVMCIATLTVYMRPDEPPLSEDERTKLELVMRTLLTYVSRNRMRDVVEELAYFDDNGYRNQRSMRNYLANKSMAGRSLINYNLRHFSLVNQEVGRTYGDVVMKNHYTGLGELIGDGGLVFRLGGDNFVAICPNEMLDTVLGYLIESHVTYDTENDLSVNIQTSVGVMSVPENCNIYDPNDIMNKSITAMRSAQMGGKEQIIFFDDNLIRRKEKSMYIQQLFPEALRNEEFRVFYQPKVNIHTGEITGAEALCRWFRTGGIVSPGDFIPVLEETNDICKLDFYMLEHVCRDLRRWIDEGKNLVRISVNLSRKHMMDAGLFDRLTSIIDKYRIPHDLIEIELTETTTDVAFSSLKRIVNELQKAGIYTSVDDFGIGYSSLNLIRAIPWNVLKIDRSILPVDEDNTDSSRSIMFRHVITMAKEMGLEVIAEGVETQQQVAVMRECGCELAQGFLFDKPLPYGEFVARLEKRFYSLENI